MPAPTARFREVVWGGATGTLAMIRHSTKKRETSNVLRPQVYREESPRLIGLIPTAMKRYTAMRTSLIASAVAWPLGAMIFYLTLVYDLPGIYYWPIISGVLFLVPLSVALCMDPAAENIETRPRRGKGGSMTFIWVIGCIAWLIFWLIFWLIRQPEVKLWLRDWKPTTVVVLLCLQIMRLSLRKALAFKVSDLYPHLRRAEKTESR